MIKTKEFILGYRKQLKVTNEIHNLLFSNEEQQQESIKRLNFYNKVKEVVIRCSEEVIGHPGNRTQMMFNIKIFQAMIKELRIRLDITKSGLAPEKAMRLLN